MRGKSSEMRKRSNMRKTNNAVIKLSAKRFMAIMLAAVLCVSVLAGCGKKDKDTKETSVEETTEQDNGQNAKEEPASKADDKAEKETPKESASDIYMSFLEGNRKCAIKSNDNDYFDETKEYTLDEMIDALSDHNNDNYIIGTVLTVSYALIDSGADWNPEMAVKIEFGDTVDRWVDDIQYLFFNYKDGVLNYCGNVEGYYRSFVDVNEYGYITEHGSNGAAGGIDVARYFNPEGKITFLYTDQYYMGLAEATIPDSFVSDKISSDPEWPGYEYADSDYYYTVDAYTLVQYDESRMDYEGYLNQFMFTFTDPQGNNVMPEYTYRHMYDNFGLECYEEKDIKKIISTQLSKLGVSDKIKNGAEADWQILDRLSDADYVAFLNGSDSAEQGYEEEDIIPYYVIDNPTWEYYNANLIPTEPGDYYSIKQESVKGNDIIDTDEWFDEIGVDPDSINSAQDDDYYYSIYGNYGDNFKPNYLLDITEKATGKTIATLDFTNYIYSEDYVSDDYMFIDESVRYAQSKDGVLYVSVYHSTYANSAPHNAYIVALDMNNDYRVLWKTQPLTCNSNNFVVLGNMIFTGYGFTAEPDYIYLIDIETGVRTGTVKVATAADYFVLNEDATKLYVRTYNKDYVFSVVPEK